MVGAGGTAVTCFSAGFKAAAEIWKWLKYLPGQHLPLVLEPLMLKAHEMYRCDDRTVAVKGEPWDRLEGALLRNPCVFRTNLIADSGAN